MKFRNINDRKGAGFTLVEVLIALAFIAIGLLAYAALQIRVIDSNERILLKQDAVLQAEKDLASQIITVRRSSAGIESRVSAETTWTDRGGTHPYQVDGICAQVHAGW